MRIGIFYFSTADGPNRQRIVLPNGGDAFVRVEEIDDANLLEGLDAAKPADDEAVMNSHELDPA